MMTDTNEFDFDTLTPIEFPVKYKGVEYILREATSGAAKQFTNAKLARFKVGRDGEASGYGTLGDLEPLLVSLCLTYAENGKSVTVQTVETFPYPMQKKLFEKAKQISDLDTQDPLPIALKLAFGREDAPTDLESLIAWLKTLSGTQYAAIVSLVKVLEDHSKN